MSLYCGITELSGLENTCRIITSNHCLLLRPSLRWVPAGCLLDCLVPLISFRQNTVAPAVSHAVTLQQVGCRRATELFQKAPRTMKEELLASYILQTFFSLLRLTAQAAARAGGEACD